VPHYLVMMQGVGIEVPNLEGGKPIIGFFATRLVSAVTPKDAELRAKSMVIADWTSGKYAESNKGSVPELKAESVQQCSFLKRLTFKNGGHAFYTDEEEDA
jgi:hypothetical protein